MKNTEQPGWFGPLERVMHWNLSAALTWLIGDAEKMEPDFSQRSTVKASSTRKQQQEEFLLCLKKKLFNMMRWEGGCVPGHVQR